MGEKQKKRQKEPTAPEIEGAQLVGARPPKQRRKRVAGRKKKSTAAAPMRSQSGGGGVAAVERALAILDAFGPEDPRLTLAELSQRTTFYKSTILRIAQSLL